MYMAGRVSVIPAMRIALKPAKMTSIWTDCPFDHLLIMDRV
jgi:hypothetical protein